MITNPVLAPGYGICYIKNIISDTHYKVSYENNDTGIVQAIHLLRKLVTRVLYKKGGIFYEQSLRTPVYTVSNR